MSILDLCFVDGTINVLVRRNQRVTMINKKGIDEIEKWCSLMSYLNVFRTSKEGMNVIIG